MFRKRKNKRFRKNSLAASCVISLIIVQNLIAQNVSHSGTRLTETFGRQTFADSISSRPTVWKTFGTDASNFISDAGDIFSSPLHFGTKEWIITGGIVGSTIAMFPADESIRNFTARQHGRIQDVVMDFGRSYGSTYGFLIAGGIYATGFVIGDDEIRATGRMTVESLIFAGVITSVLKTVLGRSRPYTEEGAYKYRGFQFQTATTALPSGHATVAFALSSVLARRINNTWASVFLYSAAGITSISRIYHDAHWASDVLLGSAIGFAIGNAVVSVNESRSTQTDSSEETYSWKLVPAFNGVSFILTF